MADDFVQRLHGWDVKCWHIANSDPDRVLGFGLRHLADALDCRLSERARGESVLLAGVAFDAVEDAARWREPRRRNLMRVLASYDRAVAMSRHLGSLEGDDG